MLSLKKIIICLFILAILPSLVSAAAPVREVNCWDYYKFYDNSYQINNFQSEKDSFNAGEMVFFSGTFINKSDLVLPQTRVMIQTWYLDNGIEFMANETFVDLGTVLPNEVKGIKGAYVLPQNAPGGKYVLEAYSLQGDYYLAGTGFLRGSPAARFGFTVNSNTKPVFFRGDKILYDQTLVNLHSPITGRVFLPSEDVSFRAYLKNNSDANQTAKVNKELYYWDGLKEFKIKDLDPDTIIIPAKTEKEIKNDLGKLGPGTYVLRLTSDIKGAKSILNIRFLVQGEKARIWYSNILGGAIKKGNNTAIVCIGNMAPTSNNPNFIDDNKISTITVNNKTVELSIKSMDGIEKNKVISQEFPLSADSIKGYLIDFSSTEDLNNFYFTTKVNESDFNQETLLFKGLISNGVQSSGNIQISNQNSTKNVYIFFSIFVLLASLILFIWYKRFRK